MMDTFTQPKITGYRQLTQHEAQLMDQFKTVLSYSIQEALNSAKRHVDQQYAAARESDTVAGGEEISRINAAQPERWISIARTHFQEGLMALTRAVAQPGSF